MKKVLSATVVSCLLVLSPMVLLPVSAYADGTTSSPTVSDPDTGYIHVLDFSDIEQEIMAHNPVVQANHHLVDSTTYGYALLNINLSDLISAKDTMTTQIAPLQTTLTGLQNALAGLKSGTPVAPPSPYSSINPLTSPIGGDVTLAANDSTLYADDLTTAATMYQTTIQTLTANRDALNKQIYQLQSQQASLAGTVDQVKLQTTMANKQLVWAAQSMYSAYDKLVSQEGDLKNYLVLLQKQLDGVNLQISLGLATDNDANSLEDKIGDLRLVVDNLGSQADAIKGDLNVLLGQPYDTLMTLNTVTAPNISTIQAVDFKTDSDTALSASYQIQIATKVRDTKQNVASVQKDNYSSVSNQYLQAKADLDKEQVNLDDTIRRFASSFSKAYEDLVSKQNALTNEQAKLKNASKAVEQGLARYNAGLISSLMLSGIQANYYSEQVKVQNLQNDLQMAFCKYEWMIKGISL